MIPFGFEGQLVNHVRWAGTQFHAAVQINDNEVRRREQVGLKQILDFQLLEAISTLPYQQPVSWEDVDPVMAAVLDCAPRGVLDTTPRGVRLLLEPPLELIGVFTVSEHWDALRHVGVFARTAPTGVVLREHPLHELQQAIHYAARFGLGLTVLGDDELQPLATPVARSQHSVGRTRIREAVFGRWLRQTGIPANSHHASN